MNEEKERYAKAAQSFLNNRDRWAMTPSGHAHEIGALLGMLFSLHSMIEALSEQIDALTPEQPS